MRTCPRAPVDGMYGKCAPGRRRSARPHTYPIPSLQGGTGAEADRWSAMLISGPGAALPIPLTMINFVIELLHDTPHCQVLIYKCVYKVLFPIGRVNSLRYTSARGCHEREWP